MTRKQKNSVPLSAWDDASPDEVRDSLIKFTLFAVAESPIEKALGSALVDELSGSKFVPIPQQQIGQFRVDFAFPSARVVVECDGHDFHERTKVQARRDRSRDRELTSSGWVVLRFTGSEIFSDAGKCAAEAARIIKRRRFRRAAR